MRVVLGVSGGVAAYKAAELVRRLQQERLEVQVVMTRHAQEFIAPLTFAALTGQKVITSMFGGEAPANVDSAVEHIGVAQGLDALVIAPATANTLAKLARGIADDFLTTLYLATAAPVIVAPAMNVKMWDHPATQENIVILRARGVRVVSPDEGYLACGMTGAGRLAGVESIAQAVLEALGIRHDLERDAVLVTAGPTCEDLDPVRYLTNRSSGKMGYGLAAAALRRGAEVTLISGPTALTPPPGAVFVPVQTAEEMREAVLQHLSSATVVIKAAAVADYRAKQTAPAKIKGKRDLTLELTPNPDILAEVARYRTGAFIVGFAAETHDVAAHARAKLEAKGIDLLVANDVSQRGIGFDAEDNEVLLLDRWGGTRALPRMPKTEVADAILSHIVALRAGAHAKKTHA